jgi:hypothetical protein
MTQSNHSEICNVPLEIITRILVRAGPHVLVCKQWTEIIYKNIDMFINHVAYPDILPLPACCYALLSFRQRVDMPFFIWTTNISKTIKQQFIMTWTAIIDHIRNNPSAIHDVFRAEVIAALSYHPMDHYAHYYLYLFDRYDQYMRHIVDELAAAGINMTSFPTKSGRRPTRSDIFTQSWNTILADETNALRIEIIAEYESMKAIYDDQCSLSAAAR